jgi:hypothetical protein
LFKRGKKSRALAVKFSEALSEICSLLVEGIVHRPALSCLHQVA